ncbi:hypothetical protein NSK_000204 [Nannochloropsis salina CCMP1776]|uniref:Uncharacterized protein n=1 Tax=Nannochloropsis salina CCMP1776 TaxID=1027361 RepID=A0A4D9DFY4_9STRA|nr:hypothetical protein NSK_000204 [Nannochloropsis salina CCMP1776]|eukprot:TFJ88635.1 hypothetical protein NSK_000204 [Nannochloropsis salina CCMP1776]
MGTALEQAEQLLDGVDSRLSDEGGSLEALVPPGMEEGPSHYNLDDKECTSYNYHADSSITGQYRATSHSVESRKRSSPMSFSSFSMAASSLTKVGSGFMAASTSTGSVDDEECDLDRGYFNEFYDKSTAPGSLQKDGKESTGGADPNQGQDPDRLRAEAEALRHALTEMEELAEVLEAEKNALGALVRESEEKMAEMHTQVSKAEEEAARRAAATQALKAEVERMSTAMRTQGMEVQEWMARVTRLEGKEDEVHHLTTALEKARQEQERLADDSQAKVEEARLQMQAAQNELADVREASENVAASAGATLEREERVAQLTLDGIQTLALEAGKGEKEHQEQGARVCALELDLQRAIANAERAATSHQDVLAAREAHIQSLETELSRVQLLEKQQREDMETRIEAEKDQFAVLVAREASLADLRLQLEGAEAQRDEECQASRFRISAMEAEMARLKDEAANQVATAQEEQASRMKGLEDELAEAKAVMTAHTSNGDRVGKGKDKKSLLRARIQDLEKELRHAATATAAAKMAAEAERERLEADLKESRRASETQGAVPEELRQEIKILKERIHDFDDSLSQTKKATVATEEDLRLKLKASADEKESVHSALRQETMEKESLQARLDELEVRVAEAAREAGAHQEIERLQAELAHVVACKDATETSLAQTQDAKNKIEAKLQEYEEQRVAALNSAKASEEAKKEMGRLEKELNDAVAALAESREADVAKATQIGELQDRIHDLETQVRKAAEENATAMAAAKRAATVENDFHTVRIGLEDHIRTLEEKAQGQVVEWEEKVRGSADRLLAAEQEVAALQEEKAALVEKADCQKDDLEKLKIELKETYKMKGEAAVAHETALFRMKSQLEALSEKGVRLDQVEGELERLREKRKRDLEEFKRLNAHIHDLQADRAEEMEGASRQSEELREELACLREERVRLEDHAKELEESVRGRAAENTRLHEDIQRAKKTVSKIQSTANALQSALDAKAGEIAELAAALAEKETALELAKAAEATSVISGEDVQKAEEMASLQQRLVDKEKEANALSSTITELETRLSEGEQLATLAAQKNQVTVHELERRLSVAESVRDRARQEVLNASSSLHPSVVQRGGGLKVATATGDGGVDLESQQLFENEEVRDSFTAPLYRRYPLLARLPPAIDNALSQVRRRYPEQTRWVEENVLIHIDEHRARTTYFFMLHLWLLYMLIF